MSRRLFYSLLWCKILIQYDGVLTVGTSTASVRQLERVLKWLGFTEIEADSLIRQATVDTVLILSRQKESWSSLAEAMALGRSVGLCIDTIERTLNF